MVLYQAKESSATHAGYGLFSAKNNLTESGKATFLNPSKFRFAGERIAKCINSFFISGVPRSIFPLFTVSLLSLITPCVVGDPRIVFWLIFDDSSPRSKQGLVFYSFDVTMTG